MPNLYFLLFFGFPLVAFWLGVFLANRILGRRTALLFAALWLVGFAVYKLMAFDLLLFNSYQAIIAVALYIRIRVELS